MKKITDPKEINKIKKEFNNDTLPGETTVNLFFRVRNDNLEFKHKDCKHFLEFYIQTGMYILNGFSDEICNHCYGKRDFLIQGEHKHNAYLFQREKTILVCSTRLTTIGMDTTENNERNAFLITKDAIDFCINYYVKNKDSINKPLDSKTWFDEEIEKMNKAGLLENNKLTFFTDLD